MSTGTVCELVYCLTNAVLVTAARWRMLLNVQGLVWAAARDGGR